MSDSSPGEFAPPTSTRSLYSCRFQCGFVGQQSDFVLEPRCQHLTCHGCHSATRALYRVAKSQGAEARKALNNMIKLNWEHYAHKIRSIRVGSKENESGWIARRNASIAQKIFTMTQSNCVRQVEIVKTFNFAQYRT